VTVTVTPATGGGTSALTTSTTVGPPAVERFYVANQGSGVASFISVYDSNGISQTSSGGFPFSCSTCQATSIIYVPANGLLYVAEQTTTGGTDAIDAFDLNGNRQTLSGAKFPAASLNDPVGMTYDAANGLIYVVNQGASVTAYDVNGTQQTLSGNFPATGLDLPDAIAYDAANGSIYVASFNNSKVFAYDQNGALQTLPVGSFPAVSGPDGIEYNSANGFLYVVNSNSSTVTAYDASGAQQTLAVGAFGSLDNPLAIFYQASASRFYVANENNNTITVYDQNGNLQTLTGAFPANSMNKPVSIVTAP
jgi:DNA-binding beta-propeller fold protein YncE